MKLAIPKPQLGGLIGKLKGLLPGSSGTSGSLRTKLGGMLPAKLGGKKPDGKNGDETLDLDDIPAHLRPTFFQRNAHILPVAVAYAVVFLSAAGTAAYLFLNSEKIEEELAANAPRAEISEFAFVDERGTQGQKPPETETVPADLDQQTGSSDEASPPAGSDGAPTNEAAVAPAPDAAQPDTSPSASSSDVTNSQQPAIDTGPDRYAGTLAAHPDPGLVEQVESLGLLPKVGADGRVPWRVYARPSNSLETRPRIAVVVLNLGLSVSATEAAIALPGAVTLAFSPYSPRLDDWITQARAAGHEVLVGLPMEPHDFPRSDAGLLSLMTTVDANQNMLNLHRVMSEGSGYIGVVNYQGSGFTASRAALQPVMEEIAERGLVYLDTLENATSVAPEIAESVKTPYATADLMISPDQSRAAILSQLTQLELLAKTRTSAIVAVDAYPMILQRIDGWARELGSKGMVLTPLSGIISARSRES